MADNKSRESIEERFERRREEMAEKRKGITEEIARQRTKTDFIVDENIVAKDVRKSKGLTIEVDVDITEAITGLKAIQREAKEATKALRELEAAQIGAPDHVKQYGSKSWSKTDDSEMGAWFSGVSTKELSEELERRKGVFAYRIDPHGGHATLSIDNGSEGGQIPIEGPAVILVNKD